MNKIRLALIGLLTGIVAVLLVIPGEQGESFLRRIIEFLSN